MNLGGAWTLIALTPTSSRQESWGLSLPSLPETEHPFLIPLLPPGPTCHLPPALASQLVPLTAHKFCSEVATAYLRSHLPPFSLPRPRHSLTFTLFSCFIFQTAFLLPSLPPSLLSLSLSLSFRPQCLSLHIKPYNESRVLFTVLVSLHASPRPPPPVSSRGAAVCICSLH